MIVDSRLKDDFEMAQAIVNEFCVGIEKPIIHEVKISARLKSSLAYCKTYRRYCLSIDRPYSDIVVSKYLLESCFNRINRVGVLIHELLHAYFPTDHHGGNWKKYAKMISDNSMFSIQTYASEEDSMMFNVAKSNYT